MATEITHCFCMALGCRAELRKGARAPMCRPHWRMISNGTKHKIGYWKMEVDRGVEEARRYYWDAVREAVLDAAYTEGIEIDRHCLRVEKMSDGRECLAIYRQFEGFPANGIYHVHDGGYERIGLSELMTRNIVTDRLGPVPAPMAVAMLLPLREAIVEALKAHQEMRLFELNEQGQTFMPSLREWSELVVDTAFKELEKQGANP